MTTARRMCSALTAALVALPLALGACGEDAEEIDSAPTPERSPEITDITDDFFSSDAYIGRTVTVTGEVTRVITPMSFVLTGDEYGDDSLLVLSAPKVDADSGEEVTVTGTVRKFAYEAYAETYELSDPNPYAGFDAEEFLVATAAPSATAPSATSG